MNIDVQLNNKTTEQIEKSLLKNVAIETLAQTPEGKCFLRRSVIVSIAIVSSDEIAEINKKYRKRNAPTDVLSFGEYENMQALLKEEKEELFLGELIICPEYIRESAKQQSIEFENELIYITSHGLLHLLGYDHGELMFGVQDKVVANIFKNKQ